MTFTVQCPSCSSTFPVDPAKVPEEGVNARCSACASIFFVDRPPAEEEHVPVPPAPEPEEAEPRAEDEGWTTMEVIEEAEEATEKADEVPDEPKPEVGGEPEEWVVQREEATDFGSLDAETTETTGTVEPEESVERPERDDAFFGGGEATAGAPPTPEPREMADAGLAGDAETAHDVEEAEQAEDVEVVEDVDGAEEARDDAPLGEDQTFGIPRPDASGIQTVEEVEPGAAEEEEPSGEAPETMPEPEAKPAGFQFGKRDPEEKAQRLARVLVSDMIMYNPERHARALENGSLREDFEDEIKKSWEEYSDQVGDEIAESTTFFTDALNEILAKGDDVFEGSPPV